jgi:hypothetical protein
LVSPCASESDAAEVEFLKGSRRVALDIANPFNFYIFVERDGQRIAELKGLKAEYAITRDVTVHEGDANAALGSRAASTGGITAPSSSSIRSACRCRAQLHLPYPPTRGMLSGRGANFVSFWGRRVWSAVREIHADL